MKTTCIIVEDIQIAADFLKKFCEKSGLVEVKGHFLNVPDALAFLDEHKPDLIFLDVEMPGSNGFQLLDSLTYSPKIILTTSKTEYAFDAFQYHVNDYLKKPFSVEELIVRIKVLLSADRVLNTPKIVKDDPNELFEIGELVFKPNKNSIAHGVNVLQLTSRESDILKLLCRSEQQTLPREKLLTELWGDDSFFNARSLDVFITKLRKHLKSDPAVQIINIRGVGYRLVW